MRFFSLWLLCGLWLTGCAGTSALNALTPSSGYTLVSNLPFDPETGLRLDIYTPEGARNAPVVIFWHGGRWTDGAKEDFRFVGEALASRGFVAVLPDHRKYPQVRFPAFVEDGAKAVAWVRREIATHGGDPGKLFVMGHSSGAHIAAMIAIDGRYLQAVGGNRGWLTGMIGLAGPYDFMPITAPDLRDIFGPPDRFEQSQPIFFVDGRHPPLLLIHGEDDDVVWVKNARNLAQAAANAGGTVETVIYPRLSHRMAVAALGRPFRTQYDVLDEVTEFVNRRARAPQRSDRPELRTTPIQIP